MARSVVLFDGLEDPRLRKATTFPCDHKSAPNGFDTPPAAALSRAFDPAPVGAIWWELKPGSMDAGVIWSRDGLRRHPTSSFPRRANASPLSESSAGDPAWASQGSLPLIRRPIGLGIPPP